MNEAEADLMRQLDQLANDEDCSSAELKRMREVLLGENSNPNHSNGLNNVSQENHLSFANR